MRFIGTVVLTVLLATAPCAARSAGAANLIGWWLNPTPNNVWFRDGRAELVVSEQGERGADGDWPEFPARRFVATNGTYGYGCAALAATVAGKRIVRINAAVALPLQRCRATASLRKAEPRGR